MNPGAIINVIEKFLTGYSINTGIEKDPSHAVAEAQKTTTMSCVTSETKLIITDISWLHGTEKDKVTEGTKLTSVAGSHAGMNKGLTVVSCFHGVGRGFHLMNKRRN